MSFAGWMIAFIPKTTILAAIYALAWRGG